MAIRIDADDNVATAIVDLTADSEVTVAAGAQIGRTTVRQDVPYGHKFALQPIAAGEPVLKYGAAIGRATVAIEPGQHVHSHNLESDRVRGDRHLQAGSA
ncbi:MAG: UxaA family hydrolase [Azospirillaceae bacterium]